MSDAEARAKAEEWLREHLFVTTLDGEASSDDIASLAALLRDAGAVKGPRIWWCRAQSQPMMRTFDDDNVCPICGSLVNGCGWRILVEPR